MQKASIYLPKPCKVLIAGLLFMLIASCQDVSQAPPGSGDSASSKSLLGERLKNFDSQGHRGARGLLPENTVPAALEALKFGMRTIELDLAVSAEKELVVSHEPYFKVKICDLASTPYSESTPLMSLTYAEIAAVDCGSKGNADYPYQVKQALSKPTLAALVEASEAYAKTHELAPPHYNIEIKSGPELDGKYTPGIEEFAFLVLAEVQRLGILDRSTIQSFDMRALEEVYRLEPNIGIGALSELPMSVDQLSEELSFKPTVYSPHHLGLTPASIDSFHDASIKVVPWTVNDTSRMHTLIGWGVDGLITDYPDRLRVVLDEYATGSE